MSRKFAAKLLASLLALTTAAAALTLPTFAADAGWQYTYPSGDYAQSGWAKIAGHWYYFTDSGQMQTGWLKDEDSWYYLTPSGTMKTGWQQDKESWYYLDPDGKMAVDSWAKYSDQWYYLGSDGRMAANTTLTMGKVTYSFDSDGKLLQTLVKKIYSPETAIPITAQGVFEMINKYRVENGKKPLVYLDELQLGANIRAMEAAQQYGHIRPDGSSFHTVFGETENLHFYENLDRAPNDLGCCLDGWKASPPHNETLLREEIAGGAIGVYVESGKACLVFIGSNTLAPPYIGKKG